MTQPNKPTPNSYKCEICGNTYDYGWSDEEALKDIIRLLPKIRSGRELTLNYDKSGQWYVGYPNLEWDFSIDLNTTDRDVEGACLNLLSQIDSEKLEASNV